jgi:hypothetical protein
LDLLGFIRPNWDFSIGYGGKNKKIPVSFHFMAGRQGAQIQFEGAGSTPVRAFWSQTASSMRFAMQPTRLRTSSWRRNNRFASFLGEAGRPVIPDAVFAPPSPDDIQRLMRASQAYGYWNASPAESAAITGG